MGLYDRDYTHDDRESGFQLAGPRSVTVTIVLINVAVYVAQQVMGPRFTDLFSLHADWFRQPWTFYQLLTYGFLHSPNDVAHILFNMLALWMFGQEVEQRIGRTEFLAFYLTAVVAAGAMWTVSELSFGSLSTMVGASGGITAVFVLFALFYPHRQILLMYVIPVPAWLAALGFVGFDLVGAVRRSGSIACVAHLAGAVFGLYYYKLNWRLAPAFEKLWSRSPTRNQPRLRVHEPSIEEPDDSEDDLSREVDRILEKIQQTGQESLSASERSILERASRRARQKLK